MSAAGWERISVCVITLNEEANLARCLESLGAFGELLVVDSGSTDRTQQIAEAFGAKWFVNRWQGFAAQRRFAESRATKDSVLFLDADEWLSPGLRTEINTRVAAATRGDVMFAFRRRSEFLGRVIRHGDWRNDWVTRLAPRGQFEWVGQEPHPAMTSQVLQLQHCEAPLFHRPYRDVAHFRAKNDAYARMYAAKRASQFAAITHAAWRFFRGYILRAGFLDGYAGFIIAREYARMTWRKYAIPGAD